MEPIITEAHLPRKLSGPTSFKILSNILTDPLPEIGERIAKGVSFSGIPKKFVTGDNIEQRMSSPPDALSRLIANIRAISDGVILRIILKPFFAPFKNSENKSTPFRIPWAIIRNITQGIR